MVTVFGRRLGLLLFLLLAPSLAPPAAAVPGEAAEDAQSVIARIEDYLNDLGNLRARFVQINPNGKTVTGTLALARPDRMRLDYDPPSRIEIVANGWQLVYHDPQLNQLSYLRVNSTPLGFLLTDEIRLGGEVRVTDVARVGDELRVSLVRTDDPGAGEITLNFAQSPLELRGWSVVDPQGLTTYVILEDLERGVRFDRDLFVFRNPRIFGRDRR